MCGEGPGCFSKGMLWELPAVEHVAKAMCGFPKIRGTISRVPIMRAIVFWGLYCGPLILGNFHVFPRVEPSICSWRW